MKLQDVEILYETYHGSKMYGTSGPNSDTDIKGIFLPTIRDLILGYAPKTIKDSTIGENDTCSNTDVEKEYFSLQYFIELASESQTVALDMLFGPESARLLCDPRIQFIFDNKHKFITKNLKSLMGYAKDYGAKT